MQVHVIHSKSSFFYFCSFKMWQTRENESTELFFACKYKLQNQIKRQYKLGCLKRCSEKKKSRVLEKYRLYTN